MLTRVLLDESIPRRLKRELKHQSVQTVPEAGWAGVKNGELLRRAALSFDILVTMDRQLPAQQNLTGLRLAIVILIARSNALEDLLELVGPLKAALERAQPGEVLRVITPGFGA